MTGVIDGSFNGWGVALSLVIVSLALIVVAEYEKEIDS